LATRKPTTSWSRTCTKAGLIDAYDAAIERDARAAGADQA
jgi:hypothetical protein